MMSSVRFSGISKAYRGKRALDGVDLTVEPESFTVLCGPPKSGKSVLFRLLVGLERPDAGRIELDGRDVTALAPAARPVGYVPQSFALYPHLSVYDNIAYPLTLANVGRDEIAKRVDRAASILSIAHLYTKTPDQLSGGEKQRTALARGLLKNATVFVLDDPLVGLDYKLRERLMDELKALREDLRATFLYATSDSLEALTMAQHLVVFDGGRVVQHGEAVDLYHSPRHRRSLELIGFPQANLVDGTVSNGMAVAGALRFAAPAGARDGAVVLGVRPEAVRPGRGRGIDGTGLVRLVENLGGELVVYLDAGATPLTMGFPVTEAGEPAFDSDLEFTIDPADILMFDAVTGARLIARDSTP